MKSTENHINLNQLVITPKWEAEQVSLAYLLVSLLGLLETIRDLLETIRDLLEILLNLLANRRILLANLLDLPLINDLKYPQ